MLESFGMSGGVPRPNTNESQRDLPLQSKRQFYNTVAKPYGS